ncbi:tetratricopeptide repeat protein [Streptomyces qinzhouensis]|uniref:Tetratricopeptide repeat protein n=1 Tax=Streptomyces qinzhouensis TaxID=2599401 RepID=A0A5B8IHQ0_9ACTN|nr:tetratricopeptide repeat protein [Streptomyces qinzhouensis]QDY76869.1 tetratricopeptide repeat protein [Streptomyces qinzhouensis]
MASSSRTSRQASPVPNSAFRELRGQRSPGEFAAAVRKAAREIGEQVSCDARYIGRVEAGEIRCPNYAYERVFLHMFPGLGLTDLGFTARDEVRGGGRRRAPRPAAVTVVRERPPDGAGTGGTMNDDGKNDEESDVLRRAFMTSGSATVAAASFGPVLGAVLGTLPEQGSGSVPARRRIGETEVDAVEDAVRRIRLLDDRHGADGLYQRAAQPLRAAYALLDSGVTAHRDTSDRLHAGAGELAISVGWLAHDSGRIEDARSHYAEALATARMSGDHGLEAHAFSNASFLARDAGRHREAVRSAQAGGRAARDLGSPRLLSLLALREAGGWSGLGDRAGCEASLGRAHSHFERGAAEADPEWMSFFGEPELEFLQAQCWARLGDWSRAVHHARRAASVEDDHFTRNLALYRAELATSLARGGCYEEAAAAGREALSLLRGVQSSRIQSMLNTTAALLAPHRAAEEVASFLAYRDEQALRV